MGFCARFYAEDDLGHWGCDPSNDETMSVDLTLKRIGRLACCFPYTRPTIHVAGTNGKGSVTCMLDSILRASSFNVGRFNSPHLISIYDCITINDQPVTPELYHSCREQVERADKDGKTGASSFELLTVTALLIFEKANIDIAVVEVGMGGRLDATNILPDHSILVSALTTVDLDHQAFLGDTVELITREKASIARRGKPFVLGPQKHSSVEHIAEEVVGQQGGALVRSVPVQKTLEQADHVFFSLSAKPFFPPPGQCIEFKSSAFSSPIRAALPLHGTHQISNLSLALTIVSTILTDPSCRAGLSPDLLHRITPETVINGIERTSWPGRLSFHTLPRPVTRGLTGYPLVLLVDGAHNPGSSEALASYVSYIAALIRPRKRKLHLTYILSLSHSPPKTPLHTLGPLLSPHTSVDSSATVSIAVLRFTPPEGMPWVTSVAPSLMRETVLGLIPYADVWAAQDDAPVDDQLQKALEWAELDLTRCQQEGREHLVVLSGSLYL
ncbi:hypothetical protein ID866_7986, partial [Astraeus odoratus]